MKEVKNNTIQALIGLGNPGSKHYYQRHNIGFRVLDVLADTYGASWHTKGEAEQTSITINGHIIVLIKPQTFMNTSGRVIPSLIKQGIKAESIAVVHDELELPFGQVKYKLGGSHKGHNGLRSIIGVCGADFVRIRCGIGRPANKDDVPDYVLQRFTESEQDIESMIQSAVGMIESFFK
ncbi:MAG: aminoacyl-tRNA hydrolase [Candidatus Dependentiae bacterium]|nr:aminoacyl-tRNA hydrolase [Candidatus Dependentiae bacterium]